VRISEHGYDELADDGLYVDELISGLSEAVLIEDHPNYGKGPCVLVLQRDDSDQPVHVVWGIPKKRDVPAVLVTAYRPDPQKWSKDFLRRKR
jgi:hypothetical protein